MPPILMRRPFPFLVSVAPCLHPRLDIISSGKTPAAWIQERLPPHRAMPNGDGASDDELAAADAALDQCLVSTGHPLGADNERIDADLAREYGSDHADLYRPSESK